MVNTRSTVLFFFKLTFLIGMIYSNAYGQSCNIYIHGHLKDKNIFREMPLSIDWDSGQELVPAASELAPKILAQLENCESGKALLRVHGYSANVVYYILGQGRRFLNFYPDHPFVKVFKSTLAVYSYGGSFKGTPLMNKVCADSANSDDKSIIGEDCLLSLTTSALHQASRYVSSVGVPIYLIYSTKKNRGRNSLNWNGLSANQVSSGALNQNDGVFLQSSTIACREDRPLLDPSENCEKIDPFFFKDYLWVEDLNHIEMTKNRELMELEYE